jgi:predicted Zn-dependent peptidase
MTIGAAEDIRAMQLDAVHAFFRTYYSPSNASLVIAGDIETPRAFDLAEHYFGEIPAGSRPALVTASSDLRVRRRRDGHAGRPAGEWQDVAPVSGSGL